MHVPQRRRMGRWGAESLGLSLGLLLLFTSPGARGAIHIPESYKLQNMLQPPELTTLPKSLIALTRNDINMSCDASGNPAPQYRWVKDGEEFRPQRNGSGLLLAEESWELEKYSGLYRCYASNDLGTAVTQAVTVTVEKPMFHQRQTPVTIHGYEGQSIILRCHRPKTSRPTLIHWMNGRLVHIDQSERVMTGLDGNLYFSNLLRGDTRHDYACNAQSLEDLSIVTMAVVSLTVHPTNDVMRSGKPELFLPRGSHSSILALRGHNVTLECLPKGLPTPAMEWRKKDGRLESTGAALKNHNSWLVFEPITQEDDGEYECRASNNLGSVTHSFTVTVEAAPYWVREHQNLMYAPGETVRLDCLADGIPSPEIAWSMNGNSLRNVDPDDRRTVSGSSLILHDVKVSDTAVYQCEATNVHGSILRNVHMFVVELPPQILSSDGILYRAIEGGDIKMFCEAFGSPRPHVSWEREDMIPLLVDPRVSLFTDGSIELSGATYEDSGTYTCSVRHANISIIANLEVYNQTRILAGPKDVRALKGTSISLDCLFVKDPRLQDHQLTWRKDGKDLRELSEENKYSILANSTLQVTNLQLDDTGRYSCEVSAALDSATAHGSITVVAPPLPPTSVSVSGVESRAVTLRWTPGASHNSPITDFIVEVEERLHGGEGEGVWEEWQKVSGNQSHTRLSLRPFCTYRFRVASVNEAGRSEASKATEEHVTPPAAPDTNPSDVRSNSSASGTLLITWTKMDKRLHNGNNFHYRVSWQEADSPRPRKGHEDVKSPPVQVPNAGTYQRFHIKVQAVNAVGKGPEPESRIGHSAEEKPEDSPSSVSSTVLNSTVHLRWRPPVKVRGLLQGYKIYIKSLGPSDQEDGAEKQDQDILELEIHGPRTFTEVHYLRLFWRYQVSVTAFNGKGESPASPPHHFNTPEGAPGPPASLWHESPTEKSLILHWTPPLEPNGILLGYMVQHQEESEGSPLWMQTIDDPTVNHFRVNDLNQQSYYRFEVIARTAAGKGESIMRRMATLLEGAPPNNVTVVPGNTCLNLSWVPGERHRNHPFHIYYMKETTAGHWEESEVINSTQGFYSLSDLQPGTQYNLMIIHQNQTRWHQVTRTIGPVPSEMPGGFAAHGWLAGLISAIVLLVLILLILCLIKRRRGGKYAVKDKEEKEIDYEARPVKDETFGEYRSLDSDGDEKRSDSQPSLCEDGKLGSVDSLAEYGESVDIQFNEDGSFIGQYSGLGPVPHGFKSSGPGSPLDEVPPPPPLVIVPSMSSILNRAR